MSFVNKSTPLNCFPPFFFSSLLPSWLTKKTINNCSPRKAKITKWFTDWQIFLRFVSCRQYWTTFETFEAVLRRCHWKETLTLPVLVLVQLDVKMKLVVYTSLIYLLSHLKLENSPSCIYLVHVHLMGLGYGSSSGHLQRWSRCFTTYPINFT